MELFQWKEEYDLGLEKIDNQHRQMVDMLNRLYEAKKSTNVHRAIEETLDGLVHYVKIHFADEEAAMSEANYPDLDQQRRQHLEMTDEVIRMRNLMLQGGEPATFELLNFMSEWLKEHISGSDQKFGVFMHDQQVADMMTHKPDRPVA